MKQTSSSDVELTRRYHTAQMTVIACLILTLVLVGLVYAEVQFAVPGIIADPMLVGAMWIAILFFGLGAVALRRTKFSAMRLRDIASLQGVSGLLVTLQKTTVLVAMLGGAIAVMGFFIAVITGDRYAMLLRAAPIAIAVLIYCYPRRMAWQRMVELTQAPDGGDEAPSVKGRMA